MPSLWWSKNVSPHKFINTSKHTHTLNFRALTPSALHSLSSSDKPPQSFSLFSWNVDMCEYVLVCVLQWKWFIIQSLMGRIHLGWTGVTSAYDVLVLMVSTHFIRSVLNRGKQGYSYAIKNIWIFKLVHSYTNIWIQKKSTRVQKWAITSLHSVCNDKLYIMFTPADLHGSVTHLTCK